MIRNILFLLLMTLATAVQAAPPKTVTLDVEGMTCGACPVTVRLALKKVPGVIKAEADYETRSATVSYDPDKTSIQALTRATANAGYPSHVRESR